ncbi:DUF2304 domain-containing protein [Candidatus Gracilibacteria bacterium]|nr:DUF2304 domain-containing protein [Candidatus Gracilibacteria bacterium]
MTIIGVQLILIGFALFMVYVLYLHWRKRNVSNKMFGVWSLIWLVFVFFSIFPTLLAPLLKELFIVRVMDLGMIVAFMILTYVTIENNIKIKKYEEQLEKLVRKIALKGNQK